MQPSHQTQSQKEGKTFNPQMKDIEHVQKRLSELQTQLEEKHINDPKGKIKEKMEELEKMYEEIKTKMKQKTTDGEQAISEMKRGFLEAWEALKKAADQAKERLGSSPKS